MLTVVLVGWKKATNTPVFLCIKFLQYVRSPGSPLASVSWDYLSLRLAIGAGAHVYFANLRPLYKFAFFGSHVFAYVFIRSDGTNHIAFWDTRKVSWS